MRTGGSWRAEDTSRRRRSGRLTRPHRRSRKRADHKHNSQRGRRCSKYYSEEEREKQREGARARLETERAEESRGEHERKKITCREAPSPPWPRSVRARVRTALPSLTLMRVIRFHIPNDDYDDDDGDGQHDLRVRVSE